MAPEKTGKALACPKCGGFVVLRSDVAGEYLACFMCGWAKDPLAQGNGRKGLGGRALGQDAGTKLPSRHTHVHKVVMANGRVQRIELTYLVDGRRPQEAIVIDVKDWPREWRWMGVSRRVSEVRAEVGKATGLKVRYLLAALKESLGYY